MDDGSESRTCSGSSRGAPNYIDSSAILNDNRLHVFVTNRSVTEPASVRVELADLAGVEVEEYYVLLDPVPVKGEWFEGVSQPWAERLKVRDEANTHVVARYGPWLFGISRGKATYGGAPVKRIGDSPQGQGKGVERE